MYDELLKLFTSKDELRPQFCQPNTQGGIVYATDTHSLICFDARSCNHEYPPHSRLETQFLELIQKYQGNQNVSVPCAAITEAISKVDIVDDIQRIDCHNPECEDGQVFCPACEHSHDCDSCHGIGHFTKIVGKVPNPNANIEMEGIIFAPHLLQRLVTVAEKLQKPIQWVHKSNSGNTFHFDDICVVIMAKLYGEDRIKVEL